MLKLYHSEAIFSARHVPSWLLFAFSAGAVNASALYACNTFVTHVTGTVTQLGAEVARLTLMLDFGLVLLCFISGAMLSGLLINGRSYRGKRPLYALPLWITFTIVTFAGIGGHFGILGKFGGEVAHPIDFVLLSILSFAMGLQNAAVATSTGLLVRTTHLTGPATDLGIHLVELFFVKGDDLSRARNNAMLRAGKIFSFACGAALAVPIASHFGFLAFLLPAACLLAATLLSFWPRPIADEPPQDAVPEPRTALPATDP